VHRFLAHTHCKGRFHAILFTCIHYISFYTHAQTYEYWRFFLFICVRTHIFVYVPIFCSFVYIHIRVNLVNTHMGRGVSTRRWHDYDVTSSRLILSHSRHNVNCYEIAPRCISLPLDDWAFTQREYMYVCIYNMIYVFICTWYMYVFIYVCIYLCMNIYIYIQIY